MKFLSKWELWVLQLQNIKMMYSVRWLMEPPNTIFKNKKKYLFIH